MKVTSTETTATVVRHFSITQDYPVVDHPGSYAGKKIQVHSGQIEYTWTDGGWAPAGSWAARISGPALKKDGTPGLQVYSGPAEYGWLGPSRADYAWLRTLVELLRPAGAPRTMRLTGAEVRA